MQRSRHTGERLVIYGAGDGGAVIVRELLGRPGLAYKMLGFIDDDSAKLQTWIQGYPVLGGYEALASLVSAEAVDRVVISTRMIDSARLQKLEVLRSDAGHSADEASHPARTRDRFGRGVYPHSWRSSPGAAGDAEAFVEGIRQAIENTLPAEAERRVEAAQQNSWETRIAQMSALVEEALATRAAAGTRWEDTLRRLYRSARRRVAWAVLSVTIGYVAVFQSPLVWTLAEPLRIVEQPRAADAIVVFAGGVGESGRAGGGYQERVALAADLFQAGHASNLVFSSGFAFFLKEADLMKTLAVSLGVPPGVIVLEQQAASTNENVAFVREILDQRGWRRILLVSSPYHMRRAMMTWRKLAPEVEVTSVPVPQSRFYRHAGGASLEQIGGILHEYAAIVFYWWKGWI